MRFTVKLKLGLTFGAVILLSAITAWLGISNLAALDATMESVLAGPVERIQLAQVPKHSIQPAAAPRPTKHAVTRPPARSIAARHKPNGFALNLTSGGADHRDAEFEKM